MAADVLSFLATTGYLLPGVILMRYVFTDGFDLGVAAGYVLLGGSYLIIRTRGGLQAASRRRSRYAAWIMMSAAMVVTMCSGRRCLIPGIRSFGLEQAY